MPDDELRPRPYQREGVGKLMEWGSAILADEQGLGKTCQAIWYAARRRVRTLVVCQASLKENWRREVYRFAGVHAHVIDGRRPYELPDAPVYIINFDILGDPEKDGENVWARYLTTVGIQLLIIDECQAIRNWDSKRSRACRNIASVVRYRLGLSGTPIENRPAEFYPIIRICAPNLFPSQKEYLDRYCDPTEQPWGREYKGASNTEELHSILVKNCLIRRLKVDVLKDLPPKTVSVLPLQLGKKAAAEYTFARRDFLAWLIRTYGPGRRVDAAANAERLTRFAYMKMLAAKLKFPLAVEYVVSRAENTDRKLLTFGWHRAMVTGLAAKFPHAAVTVGGWVPPRHRQPLFDAFNNDKRFRIFCGQIQAAGIGWNCTSSSDVTFTEMAWMPALHSQAIDRAHGLYRGTGEPVTATFLVAKDTIEEDLCKVIQAKQNTLDMILDGKRFHNLNVYDLLTRHYLDAERTAIT